MKLPPLEKIPEAYSAIADNRVEMGVGRSTVKSSDGQKEYLVEWDGDLYSSNDNATYWQGYPGYPIIAVLLLQGRLPYSREDAFRFAGVNWKKINTAHKNNYASALGEVLAGLENESVDADRLHGKLIEVHQALAALNLKIKRGRLKSTKS